MLLLYLFYLTEYVIFLINNHYDCTVIFLMRKKINIWRITRKNSWLSLMYLSSEEYVAFLIDILLQIWSTFKRAFTFWFVSSYCLKKNYLKWLLVYLVTTVWDYFGYIMRLWHETTGFGSLLKSEIPGFLWMLLKFSHIFYVE